MKPELKSAAILAGTLALGVVLGMMAQAGLARGRSAELARLRQPPGFVAHFERQLEPDSVQAASVHAVLEATAARNDRIIAAARNGLRAELDSMFDRLVPVLTEAQQRRLKAITPGPDPFRPPPPRDGPPRDGRPPNGPPPS